MKDKSVNINFAIMGKALMLYVKQKAKASGSKIIYSENGILIEENPTTNTKIILPTK